MTSMMYGRNDHSRNVFRRKFKQLHLKKLIRNTWTLWVEILGPSLTSNVPLSRLLNFIKLRFPRLKVGLRIVLCCRTAVRAEEGVGAQPLIQGLEGPALTSVGY